jgi:hypothetical protein
VRYASLIDFYDSWSETEKADGLRKMIPQDESSGGSLRKHVSVERLHLQISNRMVLELERAIPRRGSIATIVNCSTAMRMVSSPCSPWRLANAAINERRTTARPGDRIEFGLPAPRFAQ